MKQKLISGPFLLLHPHPQPYLVFFPSIIFYFLTIIFINTPIARQPSLAHPGSSLSPGPLAYYIDSDIALYWKRPELPGCS